MNARRVDGGERWLLRGALACFALAGALAIAIILLSGCASSSLGKGLNVAVIGSAVADQVSTRYAIHSGCCREGNAFLGDGTWRQLAMKVGGVGLVLGLAALADRQEHPRWVGHLVRLIPIGIWSGAAIHNWRLAK